MPDSETSDANRAEVEHELEAAIVNVESEPASLRKYPRKRGDQRYLVTRIA